MILRKTRQQWSHLLQSMDLGRTLDAACGEGDFGEELLVEGRGMTHLIGVDIDPNAISEAKTHFGHHAPQALEYRFFCDSLDRVATAGLDPSPSWATFQGYDTVALSLALHHLRHPGAVLTLLWSLVAPGGRLIISEVVADHLTPAQETARDLHHLKAQTDRLLGIEHNPTYNAPEIVGLIEQSLGPKPREASIFLLPEEDEVSWNPKVLGARTQFMADYILLAKDYPEYRELRREYTRLSQRITETGFCPPPRLVYLGVR